MITIPEISGLRKLFPSSRCRQTRKAQALQIKVGAIAQNVSVKAWRSLDDRLTGLGMLTQMRVELVLEIGDEADVRAEFLGAQPAANPLAQRHLRLAAAGQANMTDRRHVHADIEDGGADQYVQLAGSQSRQCGFSAVLIILTLDEFDSQAGCRHHVH